MWRLREINHVSEKTHSLHLMHLCYNDMCGSWHKLSWKIYSKYYVIYSMYLIIEICGADWFVLTAHLTCSLKHIDTMKSTQKMSLRQLFTLGSQEYDSIYLSEVRSHVQVQYSIQQMSLNSVPSGATKYLSHDSQVNANHLRILQIAHMGLVALSSYSMIMWTHAAMVIWCNFC